MARQTSSQRGPSTLSLLPFTSSISVLRLPFSPRHKDLLISADGGLLCLAKFITVPVAQPPSLPFTEKQRQRFARRKATKSFARLKGPCLSFLALFLSLASRLCRYVYFVPISVSLTLSRCGNWALSFSLLSLSGTSAICAVKRRRTFPVVACCARRSAGEERKESGRRRARRRRRGRQRTSSTITTPQVSTAAPERQRTADVSRQFGDF